MKFPKVQDGLFALKSISYHFSALFSISQGLRLHFPASRPAGLLLGLPGGLGRRLEAARRVELGVCVWPFSCLWPSSSTTCFLCGFSSHWTDSRGLTIPAGHPGSSALATLAPVSDPLDNQMVGVSYSVWAAIPKYHRLMNNRNFCLTVLGAGSPWTSSQGTTTIEFSWEPSSGLQAAMFLLHSLKAGRGNSRLFSPL